METSWGHGVADGEYQMRAPSRPLQEIHLVRGLCTRINTIIHKHLGCLGTPPPASPTLLHNIVFPSNHRLLQYLPYNTQNIGNDNIV